MSKQEKRKRMIALVVAISMAAAVVASTVVAIVSIL